MTLLNKVFIWLGAFLLIGALGFIIYNQIESSRRQDAIEQNVVLLKQLADGTTRSQSTWATREDVEKLIKESSVDLQVIKKDLNKLNADISTINVAVSASQGQHNTNVPTIPGSTTNPNPIDPTNPDPYGYMRQQQTLKLSESFGDVKLPIGSVGFSAWQKDPWNYDVKGREYHLNTIVGTDDKQRQYYYNKFIVKIDGKDYIVPIQSAVTQQVYPEAKWSWWNPRLFIGVDGGVNINQFKGELTPNIDVALMSYGKYTSQPDFFILQFGVGYGINSEKPQFIFTPVTYNVGQHIPLMNNAYVGPSIHVGSGGDVSIMAGVKVGL
jgi:hypothetical protein